MRLLDLFCGAGGAAMGYHQAGFDEIVGVDLSPQPEYPFEFIQMDALTALDSFATDSDGPWSIEEFDLIHASPPCQSYTPMSNRYGSDHPQLITAVRETSAATGIPYIIENVQGAGPYMISPLTLTGEMFGLTVHRPRLFELGGWTALTPPRPPRQSDPVAVYGKPDGRRLWTRKDGSELRAWASVIEGQQALKIPWVTDWHGLREAIPPAYTRYLAEQFIAQHSEETSP